MRGDVPEHHLHTAMSDAAINGNWNEFVQFARQEVTYNRIEYDIRMEAARAYEAKYPASTLSRMSPEWKRQIENEIASMKMALLRMLVSGEADDFDLIACASMLAGDAGGMRSAADKSVSLRERGEQMNNKNSIKIAESLLYLAEGVAMLSADRSTAASLYERAVDEKLKRAFDDAQRERIRKEYQRKPLPPWWPENRKIEVFSTRRPLSWRRRDAKIGEIRDRSIPPLASNEWARPLPYNGWVNRWVLRRAENGSSIIYAATRTYL